MTLALGEALERAGCTVEYHDYHQAFGGLAEERVTHQLRFPWRFARFLARRAGHFDVIDCTTGDAWVWAALGRPGGRRSCALITRSHGLEQVADERTRRAAREGGEPLGWKYPLYHGGLRLWEVRRSLRAADHCILLNSSDRDYAQQRLGVEPERLTVMPNGIPAHFHAVPDAQPAAGGPLRLAFVGSWIPRKGRQALVRSATALDERGLDFTLAIFGTGDGSGALEEFPASVRRRITLTPTYPNQELPALLAGQEVLLFPSLAEGSSVALLEGMACGLAPVATGVGAAPDVIEPERDGLLIPAGDADALTQAVLRLGADRDALGRMRRHAQETARGYRWERIAEDTLALYRRVLAARSTTSTNGGATLPHV